MTLGSTLDAVLEATAGHAEGDLAEVIIALSSAAVDLAALIARGPLAGNHEAGTGRSNGSGDGQTELDVVADRLFRQALGGTPVAVVASEEADEPELLSPSGSLALVIDPLDGSSNIAVNISVGTIFGVSRVTPGTDPRKSVLSPGSAQIAAGFFVYGPQTSLVLALPDGVRIFLFDREAGAFRLIKEGLAVPRSCAEFAINASNSRHWGEPIRAFVEDCLEGEDGPRGSNFNMRWIASLVAEAYRILARGGVFLYPADQRRSYERGRLRLVYEANPIAFIIEKAGGAATDGVTRILDLVPRGVHDRTPLVFGSAETVASVARYHDAQHTYTERSPLFSRRGLLRV